MFDRCRDLAAAFAQSDARIAVLEEMPVDGALACALLALRAAPVDAQSAVRVHALWAKLIAWASAQQMIATKDCTYGVRAFYPSVLGDEHLLAGSEIAAATSIPHGTAMAHLELVDECMPQSWEALARGDLSLGPPQSAPSPHPPLHAGPGRTGRDQARPDRGRARLDPE
jgi:hypothetical protein